jgi:hypothetical protein
MSRVISFRLDPDNPREGRALEVLGEWQEQGYRVRYVLTEALLRLAEEDQQSKMAQQMASVLAVLTEIRAELEQLQQRGVVEPVKRDQNIEEQVSEAFIHSVKSAAKPGIRLRN